MASNWKDWLGKREVHHDTPVRIRFRMGQEARDVLPANRWRWKWGSPFPADYAFDIVAYEKVTDEQ